VAAAGEAANNHRGRMDAAISRAGADRGEAINRRDLSVRAAVQVRPARVGHRLEYRSARAASVAAAAGARCSADLEGPRRNGELAMRFSLRTIVMAIVALAVLTVAALPAAAQQSSAPAARHANNNDPEVFSRPWTMNPWVSVKTNEPILENPPCVETDIDHVTSFDEKTKR